jgi:cob(I)alamin adenosyltransferase
MKVYTKRGDKGETGLLFGGRVSKADPRCEAYGAADTAVSAMGLARALCESERVKEILLKVQREMFTVGAELATDPSQYQNLRAKFSVVTADMVSGIEGYIDEIDAQIDLPRDFIVPGGSAGSAALDLARGLLRESERRVVALNQEGKLATTEVLRYLNRLSDLLFMLARLEDKDLPFELTRDDGQ